MTRIKRRDYLSWYLSTVAAFGSDRTKKPPRLLTVLSFSLLRHKYPSFMSLSTIDSEVSTLLTAV